MHGGCEDHGGGRHQNGRGQQIIGPAGRQTGQQVRGRRRYDDELGPFPHLHVLDGCRIVEDTCAHRASGDGGEGRGPDEAQCGLGRDRAHLMPLPAQQSDDGGGLVGGDRSGHADDDVPRPRLPLH